MRIVVLIATLVLATNTMAEEKPKSVTKELDKSSPLLMSTESPDDTNSGVARPRDAASGLPTGKRQHSPAAPSSGDGGDYNSSRSNKTHTTSAACNGKDDDCTGTGGQTRAQDYNSSRSNTTTVRFDDDSDGDSLEEVRCSRVSDECVDSGDGDDPVLRKRPGKQ